MSYLWAYILPQRSQRPDHVGKCCLIKKSLEWEDKQRKQRSKKFYGWGMYSFALKQRQFTALVSPHVHILSPTAKQNLSPSPSPVPLPHSLLGRWPSLAGLHDTNYLSNLQEEISHLLKAVLWLLTHPSNPTQTPASPQITNTWCWLSPLPGVKMAVPKPFAVSRGPWTQGLIFAPCPSSPVFDTADSQTPCNWWYCHLTLKDNCSLFWFYIWMEALTLWDRISF